MRYRILIVGPSPPPYHGVSVMTENLLQSNLCEEFDFVFLDIADRRGINNIGALEITNILLAIFHVFKFIYMLIRFGPDLVYLQISQTIWGYFRDLLFFVPSRLLKKKVLIHLHGGEFKQFYASMPVPILCLTRYVFKKNVWGVVLGKSLIPQLDFLIPQERIFVVPNGIKGFQKVRGISTIRNGKTHILYLANLMESKGFLDLLGIVPEIVRHHPKTIFTFAGEKTYNAEIEKAKLFIAKYNLEDHIEMPGVVKGLEKEALLRNADIFVFPPIAQEGQPLVILEAMAAGLPVISTDRGAIKDTIVNGVTGFAEQPGHHDALLKRLVQLIENKSVRQKMGSNGESRFREHYTLARWVSDMGTVFNEVLGVRNK